ncbi:MAG: tryptophan-rich sensory protein [Thermomicrobiales bacterium]|nr:tryptophan-rich sensory protein [Thermomicrobiales bacterium]MCO5225272.1 tryptophan-rich sensory protein [Thermomicrobiales bacterium]
MRKSLPAMLICVAVAFLPAISGLAVETSGWYNELSKPPLTPPGWVFGPAWTTLYLTTGIALYLIWRSPNRDKQGAYGLFGLHLVLNTSWTLVFFGLEQIGLALVVILTLLIIIGLCISRFNSINPWASRLFMPYFAWVAFATYLNAGIAWLN